MKEKRELSDTMRIDLIPYRPGEPVPGKRKRVIISSPKGGGARGRKAAEAVEGSSRYEELFQGVYDAAVVCDLKGTIVDVNVRAIEFLGYERAELCGLSICDVISGADSSLIGTLIENLENERFTVIQAYCARKDDSLFPSEIAVNKLRLGALHLCFFVRDITLRKQAEEMLITEHNAIQNGSDGIAVANLKLELEYVNPAVASMWGYDSTDEMLGMHVRSLLSNPETAVGMADTVIRQERTWVRHIEATRREGGEFHVQVSAACNRNSDDEVVGVVFSFTDTSDRKRAEDAERESERRRVMLESLGAACHHLGQPATILLANLSVMKSHVGDDDEKLRELVNTSLEAVDRLGKILHKLKAVNEYKTTEYLRGAAGGQPEHRILEI